VAEEYMKNGSEISTYLRDRKDESKAFSAWQKALLGNKDQVAVLSYLASQKPQNYSIRTQHIEALIANNEYKEALKNLQQIYRTLQASQVNRPEYELLFAEVYSKLGMTSDLAIYLEKLMVRGGDPARLDPLNNQRLIRLLVANDRLEEAKTFLKKLNPENSIFYKSSELVSKALINIKEGKNLDAIRLLDNALEIYPYQIDGLRLLKELSKIDKTADKILTQHLKEMEISPIL
jgi:tetratricopeptide (TPR) repeat protein